jgi:hypothetical protein
MTPVFSRSTKAYTAEQLVHILLGEYSEESLCISQPVNISHNMTFLVQMSHLKHPDDIKCDDMGSWKHSGSPKHCYCVTKSTEGITSIQPLKTKPSDPTDDVYELKRVYYQNSSDETIRKLVAKLEGLYC